MGCICSKGVSDDKHHLFKQKDKSRRQHLMRLLGVSDLQEKQIIVSFQDKTHEQVLKVIYNNWKTLQHESSVIEALKEIKFVKSGDPQSANLYKPNELFDPCDALLKSVFSGDVHKFPAESFGNSDKWLNILRKTGLKNSGDAHVLIECAERVELLGRAENNNTNFEVSIEIWSLAETIVGAICNNSDIFRHKKLCKILGEISCIPAEKGYPFDSEKKGGVKRVLCSYSEAVLLKDWALSWRVAPIISNQKLVPPEYSWEDLQLRTPPPFSVVLNHVQDRSLTKSSFLAIEEATLEVLQYLDRIWDTISSSDIAKLRKKAFIVVSNKIYLATAGLIFTNITIDLRPIAYQLPSCYLPFLKILKELGLKDEMLSISSALSILACLKMLSGNQRLSPNEIRAVIKVLEFICDEIEHQPNSDTSEWESRLVVPDDSCRLVDPHSCVYIDPRGSLYLKYIDTSKLRFVHRHVSERLCLAFGVKKLSDVVVAEEVTLPIGSLLLSPDDFETNSLVDDKKVMGGRAGFGTGLLGQEVTPEDMEKVKFHPWRPFYKGEIVAWKSIKTDKFKYGIVTQDTTPPATTGHPPYKLDIETSPGNTETVVSSHVYYFSVRKAKHVTPKNGHNEA